jgi:dihydrofolate reductase
MARILASVHLSLDGVMDAPEQWCTPSWSAELTAHADRQVRAAREVLLGRNTYNTMPAWLTVAGEPFVTSLNAARIHVASSTLKAREAARRSSIVMWSSGSAIPAPNSQELC